MATNNITDFQDIYLAYNDDIDDSNFGTCDIVFGGTEASLQTAVLMSLFSWRRAHPDDILYDERRYGWWGDTDTVKIGSRLWLLHREKVLPSLVQRVDEYCKEALQWMIDDFVCQRIDIASRISGLDQIKTEITIYRFDKPRVLLKFSNLWDELKRNTIGVM